MTLSELYLEAARVAKMIEGTDLLINDVIKIYGIVYERERVLFRHEPEAYEFALAIVEGKPVFKGDELYDGNGCKIIVERTDGVNIYGTHCNLDRVVWDIKLCSFSPKPKTVMVELLVEDAHQFVDSLTHGRVSDSIRKALGEL
jgi:hypothetical protein